MQTYEIPPDESMETLVRSLSRAVRKDKDLVLVVPAGNTLFSAGGAESIGKLGGIMRSYDARLQVQAADPSVVALFRAAGLQAGPLAAGSVTAPIAAPQYPPAPAPLQYTAAPAPPTPSPPVPAPPAPQPLGGLSEDISNMNFDFEEVGVTPRAATPAATPAPSQGGGGFAPTVRVRRHGLGRDTAGGADRYRCARRRQSGGGANARVQLGCYHVAHVGWEQCRHRRRRR